jgi:hypothetical protein
MHHSKSDDKKRKSLRFPLGIAPLVSSPTSARHVSHGARPRLPYLPHHFLLPFLRRPQPPREVFRAPSAMPSAGRSQPYLPRGPVSLRLSPMPLRPLPQPRLRASHSSRHRLMRILELPTPHSVVRRALPQPCSICTCLILQVGDGGVASIGGRCCSLGWPVLLPRASGRGP